MAQRNLTGIGFIDLAGIDMASGTMYVKPVGVMPYDPDEQEGLVAIEKKYKITAGQLEAEAKVTAGARYKFRVIDDVTDRVVIPEFEAPVPEVVGAISFWDLYATGNVYSPPGFTLDHYQLKSEKGEPLGYAELGADGKVPAAQLPAGGGGGGTVTSVNGDVGPAVVLDHTDVGAAPAVHSHAQADVTGLPAALAAKADLVGGVIPTAQLPALAINDISTVANEAAMLALVAQRGDVAVRSDTGRTWILATDDPTLLANWVELPQVNVVTSVNGQAGVVVLGAADVDAPTLAALATEVADRIAGDNLKMAKSANLSDVADVVTSRTNLGLGTAATHDVPAAGNAAADEVVLGNDTRLSGAGAGASELEYYRTKAALLEPNLLEQYRGLFTKVIPDDEDWWILHSYSTKLDGYGLPGRLEVREVSKGPLRIYDETFKGIQAESFATLANILGIDYADNKDEFFRKLAIINSRPMRYRQAVAVSALEKLVSLNAYPSGAIALTIGMLNAVWSIWTNEGGDTPTVVGDVGQDQRRTENLCHPFTPHTQNLFTVGPSYNWGFPAGTHDPQAWLEYVNLPADFHGVVGNWLAPNGYQHVINSVDGMPANVDFFNDTADSIFIADKFTVAPDWIGARGRATPWVNGYKGKTSGGNSMVFTPLVGNTGFTVWLYNGYTLDQSVAAAPGWVLGCGRSSGGIHYNDVVNGFYLNGDIWVLHDGGAGRNDREFTTFNMEVNRQYLFRVEYLANGGANYYLQTNSTLAGATGAPIGGTVWIDLLQGTVANATATIANQVPIMSTANGSTEGYVAHHGILAS